MTAAPPSLGALLPRLLARALPGRRVVCAEPLAGGASNASWRVRLDPALDVVLRVYTRDPAACRKEVALHGLVQGAVRVPEIAGLVRGTAAALTTP